MSASTAPSPNDPLSTLFSLNGFYTEPYTLRQNWTTTLASAAPDLFGTYSGDAMHPGGGSGGPTENLVVPPNTAAVVLLANGEYRTLPPGRHKLHRVLRDKSDKSNQLIKPVSVQFVNKQRQTLAFDELKVHTHEHMELDIDLVVVAQVSAQTSDGADGAQAITELGDPRTFIRNVLLQELIKAIGHREHGLALETLPSILTGEVLPPLNNACRMYGVRVDHVLASHVHPDKVADDLEKSAAVQRIKQELEFRHKVDNLKWRGSVIELDSEIQRREAQVEEDVAALKQPGMRRKIMGELGGQARERNQAARMEAIGAVQDAVKVLLEQMHQNPGRSYSSDDMAALLKALELLDRLADPTRYPAPPVPQQVRSIYAVDDNQPLPPPVTPPAEPLPVKAGSVWDKKN